MPRVPFTARTVDLKKNARNRQVFFIVSGPFSKRFESNMCSRDNRFGTSGTPWRDLLVNIFAQTTSCQGLCARCPSDMTGPKSPDGYTCYLKKSTVPQCYNERDLTGPKCREDYGSNLKTSTAPQQNQSNGLQRSCQESSCRERL